MHVMEGSLRSKVISKLNPFEYGYQFVFGN